MRTITPRPGFLLPIVLAPVVGGIVSLLTTFTDQKFWRISISSHCGLIAFTFWIYREKNVSLNSSAGLFNAFTLFLIASLSPLVLFFVMGFYVPFGLIITGRAFLNAFVATFFYAYFRTLDSH